MEFEIRLATEQDIHAVQDLLNQLVRYEWHFHQGLSQRIGWAYTDSVKASLLKSIENELLLVACHKGLPVGYLLGYIKNPTENSLYPISSAHIENLFIAEEWRKKGLGEDLVNKFSKIAKEKGAKRLTVTVLAENEGGVKFYEKMGLVPRNLIFAGDL